MKEYEQLYFLKNNEKVVQKYLKDFLLFQIYSPEIIRQAYVHWPELDWFLRENTPFEIKEMIRRSSLMSEKELKRELYAEQIKKAINILKGYQACDVPLTTNPHIAKNKYNLLSQKGEKALKILEEAHQKEDYTDKMVDLAVFSTHKFLGDKKYYLNFKINRKCAQNLAIPSRKLIDNSIGYIFPTIQLTKGCLNHCSHCDSRAEGKISHMPWPVFRTLYKRLNKYYRHYPQKEIDFYFSSFFADSDMLDYYDPISKTDAGDVGLWIDSERGNCQYLTRGVKTLCEELALAKALLSGQSVAVSFVDTPKENKEKNLQQLNRTLDVVESVSERKTFPEIIHLHLKSGPSVSEEIFRGNPVKKTTIYALGRAKDFPKEEVDQHKDKDFLPKFIFSPDGSIDLQVVKNGEVERERLANLFTKYMGPHINPKRLFFRKLKSRIKN